MEDNMRLKFFEGKINDDIQRKKELQIQRIKDEESMKQSGSKTHKNVVLPVYADDERLKIKREITPPPPSLFIALGYNATPTDNRKHYRRYYPNELENISEVMPNKPFHEEAIMRG